MGVSGGFKGLGVNSQELKKGYGEVEDLDVGSLVFSFRGKGDAGWEVVKSMTVFVFGPESLVTRFDELVATGLNSAT